MAPAALSVRQWNGNGDSVDRRVDTREAPEGSARSSRRSRFGPISRRSGNRTRARGRRLPSPRRKIAKSPAQTHSGLGLTLALASWDVPRRALRRSPKRTRTFAQTHSERRSNALRCWPKRTRNRPRESLRDSLCCKYLAKSHSHRIAQGFQHAFSYRQMLYVMAFQRCWPQNRAIFLSAAVCRHMPANYPHRNLCAIPVASAHGAVTVAPLCCELRTQRY